VADSASASPFGARAAQRARLRAELRASGVPLVELRGGNDARDPVQAALAELSSLGRAAASRAGMRGAEEPPKQLSRFCRNACLPRTREEPGL